MLTESLLKLSKTFKCDSIKMIEPVLISCSDPNKQKFVQSNINHYNKDVLKVKDFEDFKEASLLIKSKSHLTKECLEKIIFIKSRMNFNR